MEREITKYFDNIINDINNFFSNVEYTIDRTPHRAILRINATYQDYRVFVTELISKEYRKYNYYLLSKDYVVVGLDNSQDIRAIKLKYKSIPDSNAERLVPHKHLKNKTILELTEEYTITGFIDWIKINIPE
ncbi:MAG: hypothetical protein ABFS35_13975 [Bacteroidota bacterium]